MKYKISALAILRLDLHIIHVRCLNIFVVYKQSLNPGISINLCFYEQYKHLTDDKETVIKVTLNINITGYKWFCFVKQLLQSIRK